MISYTFPHLTSEELVKSSFSLSAFICIIMLFQRNFPTVGLCQKAMYLYAYTFDSCILSEFLPIKIPTDTAG